MKRPGRMLRLALHSVTQKPVTRMYPFVKRPMPPRFRGMLKFYPERCIGCKICMRDCPARAIEIRKVGDKQFECDIDCSKCIYCAQCVESCPKDALESTNEYELAGLTREQLKVTYRGLPKPPAAPAGEAPKTEPTK